MFKVIRACGANKTLVVYSMVILGIHSILPFLHLMHGIHIQVASHPLLSFIHPQMSMTHPMGFVGGAGMLELAVDKTYLALCLQTHLMDVRGPRQVRCEGGIYHTRRLRNRLTTYIQMEQGALSSKQK